MTSESKSEESNPEWDEEQIVFLSPRHMLALSVVVREWQDIEGKTERSDQFKTALLGAKKKLLDALKEFESERPEK